MEDTAVEEPEVSGALVAAHPHGNSVAVANSPLGPVFACSISGFEIGILASIAAF
jgi:hypothetical protein